METRQLPDWSASREARLLAELRHAYGRAPGDEVQRWALDVPVLLGRVTLRRGIRLVSTVGWLLEKAGDEVMGAVRETGKGQGLEHLKARGEAALGAAQDAYESGKRTVDALTTALTERPSETAPKLLIGVLAAVATSGGPDGNGGAPDLDLEIGIDAHRSILTHSVLTGAVIETGLLSLAQLMGIVHQYLPPDHDALWDEIAKHKDDFLAAASQGASFGIAYHLLVDATVQPGAYHDLPVPLPIEGHQAILGANAAAEALDARKRRGEFAREAGRKRRPLRRSR
jgi:hypothetical protein